MTYWRRMSLHNEKNEVTNTLAAIEREKQQLIAAIYNKSLEKARKTHQILSNVAKFIIQNPEETITHEQETFGDLVTNESTDNETVNQPSGGSEPSPSTSGSSSQSKDPLESLYLANAIYVNNLSPGIKRSDLNRFCNRYGSIRKIMKRSTKSSSAVVVFHTTSEAKLALEALNGQMLRLWYIEGSRQINQATRLKVQYAPLAVCNGYKFLDI